MKKIKLNEKQKKIIKSVIFGMGICLIVLILLCVFRCSCVEGHGDLENSQDNELNNQTDYNDFSSDKYSDKYSDYYKDNLDSEKDFINDSETENKKSNNNKLSEERKKQEINKEENKISEKNQKNDEFVKKIEDEELKKSQIESEKKNQERENKKEKSQELKEKKTQEEKEKKLREKSDKELQELKEKELQEKKSQEAKEKSTRLDIIFNKIENVDSKESEEEKNRLLNEAIALSREVLDNNEKNHQGHYFMAKNALNNKEYDKAQEELEKAISYGENYLYYYELGKLLYRRRNFSGAEKAFSKSCDLNMNFPPSRYNLGLTYIKENNLQMAMNSFNTAIEIKPDYEQAYLGKARLYKQVRNYNDALIFYKKVLEINPENISALMDMGLIYNEQKKYQDAVNIYETALKKSQKGEIETIIKYNLSFSYYNLGNITEALKYANESYKEKDFIRDKNQRANIIYNYGLILDKSGEKVSGANMYNEAIMLNNHLKAKVNLSVIYMGDENRNIDKALILLQEAYSQDSENFEINNNLGNAYILNGDFRNAEIYLTNALKLHPNDRIVKSNLGNACLQGEDYGNAKKIYMEIITSEPENWQAYLNMAKICIQLNEDEEALYYLVYLKEKNPDFRTSEVASLLAVLNI